MDEQIIGNDQSQPMVESTKFNDTSPTTSIRKYNRLLDKQILTLAIPSFGSLIVQPLMTITDSAMVGHIGTPQLGGLTIGSTLMMLIIGMCIFLAYTTTALTAQKLGEGDKIAALRVGIDGIWLAIFLGAILTFLLLFTGPFAIHILGGTGDVAYWAQVYLVTAGCGLTPMLVVLAATGVLRGLLNTRTPFLISMIGTLANIPLNAVMIYVLNLGVAGSGIGTAISQLAMAITLIYIIYKEAYRQSVSMRVSLKGIKSAGLSGSPLVVRSISLQLAVVSTVTVAAWSGTTVLAAHQIVKAIYSFMLFAMDAIAIAAQALIGHSLGKGDITYLKLVMRRCILWSISIGVVVMILMGVNSPWLPYIFTQDPQVHSYATWGLLAAAIFQPLCSLVFIFDGILIGANDTRFMAIAMVVCLAVYTCVLFPLYWLGISSGALALVVLWILYGSLMMGSRAVTLGFRIRSNAWIK